MEALLMVTLIAYIRSSLWRLHLHWGSPERWKRLWQSLDSLYWVLTLTGRPTRRLS